MNGPLKILFVCVENANRSQMAEAFCRLHGRGVECHSAGSRPSGRINPKAIASLKRRGVELSPGHRSKGLDELPQVEWDWLVTMGCGDSCPHVPARHREDWQLPDPRDLPDDQFDQVRDRVEQRVLDLLNRAGAEVAP